MPAKLSPKSPKLAAHADGGIARRWSRARQISDDVELPSDGVDTGGFQPAVEVLSLHGRWKHANVYIECPEVWATNGVLVTLYTRSRGIAAPVAQATVSAGTLESVGGVLRGIIVSGRDAPSDSWEVVVRAVTPVPPNGGPGIPAASGVGRLSLECFGSEPDEEPLVDPVSIKAKT